MSTISARIYRRWYRSREKAAALYPLRRFLPTARIRDAVMTRRGLKWGTAAMLLAAFYYEAVKYLVALIEQGGPGWLHLVVILCVYNTIKMFLLGPISLVYLAGIRIHERAQRRKAARLAREEAEASDSQQQEATAEADNLVRAEGAS